MVKRTKLIAIFFLGLFISVAYQNCSPGYHVAENLRTMKFSSTAAPSANAPNSDVTGESIPNMTTNCLQSGNQACVFWKNPVAQYGQILSPAYKSTQDLSSWPMHGVSITGYDSSGFLANSTFEIWPGGKAANDAGKLVDVPLLERVSTASGNFRFPNNDANLKLQQTSAYYWIQFQQEFMKKRTGKFYAEGKGIKVYMYCPDYTNGMYSGDRNMAFLGSKDGDSFAVQGDVIVHEMGHANVHWATNGSIWQQSGSPNADAPCPGVSGSVTCCPTKNGCVKSINEGQADYSAALVFASRPQFGETWKNNPSGLKTPADDLFRDPRANEDLTADKAYNVTAIIGGKSYPLLGEARSMATLYTAIWWSLRQKSKSVSNGSMKEMDEIFTEHLAVLNGFDTFVTARDKIITISNSLYFGKYSDLIRNEFTRRGY